MMGVEGIEPSGPKRQIYSLPGLHSRLYTQDSDAIDKKGPL